MAKIHLDKFNLDDYPYIIPSIYDLKHLTINSPHTIEEFNIDAYHIFYIKEGEFEFSAKKLNSATYSTLTAKKNCLLSTHPTQSYTLNLTSKAGEYIHFSLLFYTKKGFSGKILSERSNLPTVIPYETLCKCENVPVDLYIPPMTEIKEYSPMYITIKNIINEIDTLQHGYFNILQSLITQLFLQLFRNLAQDYINIYSNVNQLFLAAFPERSHMPLPENCTINIKDISIHLKENQDSNKNKTLQVFSVENFYINPHELCTDLSCKYILMPKNDQTDEYWDVLQIKTKASSYYKIAIPTQTGTGTNLFSHIHSAFLKLDIKSSHNCTAYFTLVNTKNYSLFFREIFIPATDKWHTIQIPLIGNKIETKYSPYITETLNFINKNYLRTLHSQEIAKHINISVSHLTRIFKKELGIPLNRYINLLKLEKVKELLSDTDLSIEEIAKITSFYDATYLCKSFKKYTGITPATFRQSFK